MNRLSRGLFIVFIVLRFGLDELVLSSFSHPWLRRLTRLLTLGRSLSAPRGQRLREALESVTPPAYFGESEQRKVWWAKARAALGETK